MDVALPIIDLEVDRSRALVAGLWRLLIASVLAGLLVQLSPDWPTLRLTQPASFFALLTIWLALAAGALLMMVAAVRRLLLAAWPAEVGIRITPERLEMRLGPFGRIQRNWRELSLLLDREVPEEHLELLPDDAFVPLIQIAASGEDLTAQILRHGSVDAEALTRALRPYLVRYRPSRLD